MHLENVFLMHYVIIKNVIICFYDNMRIHIKLVSHVRMNRLFEIFVKRYLGKTCREHSLKIKPHVICE